MSAQATGAGPLAGIRVVDLSRALSGPYATLMLADAGAEVVKVERPGAGDDTRGWGPPFVGEDESESAYFLSINRSKQSVTLDLKDADDLARLRTLIADADVLVENFRPGVMDRLGLGSDALEELNDRLVVLSITGFGEGGPDGQRSGFDQIIQGEAGLMGITGPKGGEPTKMGVPITDILSGMFGAYGVVAALHERERTGKGQRVTTSLLAAAVAVHTFQGTRWTLAGEVAEPGGNRHPTIAPYGAFTCADGWVNVAVGSEGLWQRFAPLVGIDVDDERYATNRQRVANWDELEAEINAVLVDDPVGTWMARFNDAGVPAGRIRSMDQVYDWDQLEHLQLIDRVSHPSAGELALPGAPVAWSRSGRRPPEPPPLLGQHDDELLGDRDEGR
ncbi:CaiB/BaiF CoA transferase family protein [Egicoccus halophilus]|uniref:CoA transferase n=1 Tax=Egicoccus halophilus TaxID=1670830 RepID=A0A8J3AB54_9ACTN|nr:CoA transferase [Egicoccus halophilus]GGI09814.1 CoA transferase [Egicoccus halophilus]